ncbi:MAG: alpha-L-glutamate ligase-like protein [Halofilum sp. (in: g-proteobacteria)]
MIRRLLPNPFARLRRAGVLGMNARNASYIMATNPRSRFPLVDDKRRTKHLAEAAGIAVPRLLGGIDSHHELRALHEVVGPIEAGFALKPAHGSSGNGILVIRDRVGPYYRMTNGRLASRDELEHHAANILSGMHSLGGLPDAAMIEERVCFDDRFDDVSGGGVPDIRTVVYRGVPIMAMMRLPTHASDGKANLHHGAVGLGIDLASGRSISAVHHDRPVDEHPDSLAPLLGRAIPGWERLLELSARCYDLCGLGYLGVDVVLDRDRGPLVLELNARPGLSVQLATGAGLAPRLQAIDAADALPEAAADRAEFARERFAAADAPVPVDEPAPISVMGRAANADRCA